MTDDINKEPLRDGGVHQIAREERDRLESLAKILDQHEAIKLPQQGVVGKLKWDQDGTSFSTDSVYVQADAEGRVIRLYYAANGKAIPLSSAQLAQVKLCLLPHEVFKLPQRGLVKTLRWDQDKFSAYDSVYVEKDPHGTIVRLYSLTGKPIPLAAAELAEVELCLTSDEVHKTLPQRKLVQTLSWARDSFSTDSAYVETGSHGTIVRLYSLNGKPIPLTADQLAEVKFKN